MLGMLKHLTPGDLKCILVLLMRGFRKNRVLSVDLTWRCNLSCKTCYFKRLGSHLELSYNQWLALIREWKLKNPNSFGGWIGGESLLRKDLLKEAMLLFKRNLLVTNGTFDWSDLPKNCSILVSLDGIGKDNDQIRGQDTYEKVVWNIRSSNRLVSTTTTINRLNFQKLAEIVGTFRNTKNVKCSYFTFYTPSKGEGFDLCLTEKEKDGAISRLLALKQFYGDFIADSRRALELMRSTHRQEVIKNCSLRRACRCLSPLGEIKFCVLGDTADCSRCGDWETHHIRAIERYDIESIRIGLRLFGVDTFPKNIT